MLLPSKSDSAATTSSCLGRVSCEARREAHDGWRSVRRPRVARLAAIVSMVWAATCGLARGEGLDELSRDSSRPLQSGNPPQPQAAGIDRVEVASPINAYYYFVHWMSVGRIDLALEQFTDDAFVVAGPNCLESSPCIGKATIQANYLLALAKGKVPLPVQDQQFDGQRLRTRGETIAQHLPGESSVNLRGGHVFEFRGGLISSVQTELDRTDALTASILEQRRLRRFGVSASAAAH
jgi:hypothetical protein